VTIEHELLGQEMQRNLSMSAIALQVTCTGGVEPDGVEPDDVERLPDGVAAAAAAAAAAGT